jgi:hypothetical protein
MLLTGALAVWGQRRMRDRRGQFRLLASDLVGQISSSLWDLSFPRILAVGGFGAGADAN